MKNVLKEQITEYIAYSKIAVHNMKSSGNFEITLEDILAEIDILPTIYSKYNTSWFGKQKLNLLVILF